MIVWCTQNLRHQWDSSSFTLHQPCSNQTALSVRTSVNIKKCIIKFKKEDTVTLSESHTTRMQRVRLRAENSVIQKKSTTIIMSAVSVNYHDKAFTYGSFSWKLVENCDIEGKILKIQNMNFLMLLFGNESLTSLVYKNIRHKLTGWQELG